MLNNRKNEWKLKKEEKKAEAWEKAPSEVKVKTEIN